jgi:hypothetical protein
MNRPKIEYVDVEGVRLRVATQAGSGGGVPLLIFNGIGANFELVFPFMEAMDGKRPFLVFGHPKFRFYFLALD